MAQKNNPYLTITLTGRPPVKVKKEDWPIIASASYRDYDNQYDFQANRSADWTIKVRQHKDGRAIVYAVYSYTSAFTQDPDRDAREGRLLAAGDDIADAILSVARDAEDSIDPSAYYGSGVFPRLARECIADLPAEELD